MALILDGNSKYVAHAWRNIDLFEEKKNQFVTVLSLSNALARFNNRYVPLRAHLFPKSLTNITTMSSKEGSTFISECREILLRIWIVT